MPSEYQFIELSISFDDGQSRCKVFIKDTHSNSEEFILGDESIVDATPGEQEIKWSLVNSNIDLSSIRSIAFDANVDYGFRGTHGFSISKIRFSR